MTRKLILIRHAKSDWDDPDLDDHDRPLNARGRLSAPRIGAWLASRGDVPTSVLCSSALRTRQTWDGIATQLPMAPVPDLRRNLYLADPPALMTAIHDHGADATCLAVLAHNPGIGALAWALAETPPAHPRFGTYPTGATLVLDFDVDEMSDIRPGTGIVRGFAVPRELPDP